MWRAVVLAGAMGSILACSGYGAEPLREDRFIIEPNPALYPHVHASSVVELRNGDLLACWYSGVSDKSKDVSIVGSRFMKGEDRWSPTFVLADTPGLSDNNPVLFLDGKKRLWLFWSCLTGASWDSAIVKYKCAEYCVGYPVWPLSESTLDLKGLLERYPEASLGWMTRNHPIELADGRILLPLYSDRFHNSIMAFTSNAGETWEYSEAVTSGLGNIQPTVIVKRDGTYLAYMRDGSPNRRVWMSTSTDALTWAKPVQIDLPNPGSALEMIRLRSGRLLLAFNSTEKDRSALTLALSDDDGQSWAWRRDLENSPGERFDYPSVIQTSDDSIHVTYSVNVKAIKQAVVNEAWILEGR